jgi:hypothetical protein
LLVRMCACVCERKECVCMFRIVVLTKFFLLLELRYETLLQGNIIQHYLVLSMMTYINISYTYRVSMTDNIVTDNQPHWLCCDWCDG